MANRASTTCTYEGILERSSSGVAKFLSKTKVWCILQGSHLQYFKENKRSSVVDAINLADAQLVRKVSSDLKRTQFEIVMKQRTHVFSAATPDECNNWIKHLQQAMILKSNTETGTPSVDSDLYESVNVLPPQTDSTKGRAFRNKSEADYEEIDEIKPRAGDRQGKEVEMTEELSDVKIMRENSLYILTKKKEAKRGAQCVQEETNISSDNTESPYADVTEAVPQEDLDKKTPLVVAEEDKGNLLTGDVPEVTDAYARVDVRHRKGASFDQSRAPTVALTEYLDENMEEDLNLMSDQFSSVPPLLYPLSAVDLEPVKTLKEFLANNRSICRHSYYKLEPGQDPFVLVKELLSKIN